MSNSQPAAPAPSRLSAMSKVFFFFVATAILCGAATDRLREVSDASFQAAKDSVTLAIGLIGVMAFWLGMVRILEAGGFVNSIARALKPLMVRLFPEVPPEHPAMGAMVMNISANMLGLGNAATPFGIKAMIELNRLNPLPGTATNAMCLFLAINTSSVTILPLGAIGVRAAAGAANPAAIFMPTLLATIASTVAGMAVAIFFAKRDSRYRAELANAAPVGASEVDAPIASEQDQYAHLRFVPSFLARGVSLGVVIAFVGILLSKLFRAPSTLDFVARDLLGFWLMPLLILAIVSYALFSGVKVYEAVTEGAKQGFDVAVRIIPFLVAILVSIAMFRASGAMGFLITSLSPVTELIGMPAGAVPMALVRPLSGSGAFGVMSELVKTDPNSYEAFVASVMNGAADTTFYILAVYFGAAGILRVRHALVAGLVADVVGMVAACFFSRLWFVPFS